LNPKYVKEKMNDKKIDEFNKAVFGIYSIKSYKKNINIVYTRIIMNLFTTISL